MGKAALSKKSTSSERAFAVARSDANDIFLHVAGMLKFWSTGYLGPKVDFSPIEVTKPSIFAKI